MDHATTTPLSTWRYSGTLRTRQLLSVTGDGSPFDDLARATRL